MTTVVEICGFVAVVVMLLLDEVSSVLNVDELSYCYRKNARFFYA